MLARNSCAYPGVLIGVHAVNVYTAEPDMTLRQSDSPVAQITLCIYVASSATRLHEGALLSLLRSNCRLDKNV